MTLEHRRDNAHRSVFPIQSLWLSIIIPVVLLCLGLSSAGADNLTVTVGVYENAPKVFTSKDGQPAGIFIDIIEFIGKSEGWHLKYVEGSWAEGLDRLAKGEIDLMPDVAYTVERGKIFSFHKIQVLTAWFQAYARKGSGIQSIIDLNGKRIAVLDKSVQQEAFIRYAEGFRLNITLVPVADYKTAFEMVAGKEADAAITNQLYGGMHAKRYGLEDTAVVFEPSALFFATAKGTHERLLNTIDRYLQEMRKDPQSIYYRSMKKWTSEEVRFKFPLWLQILGLAAGIVLLMSVGGSIVLKRQVNVRTRELQRINQEMEQRIVERTTELAEAMEKARAADRLKSAFLATMSHELRTPLNSIIGFTGILLQGLVGQLNEEQKKQLGMVRSSAHHLLSLINDVLDISKIEAGQLQVNHEPFDLSASISKVEQIVRPLAEKKGLGLTVNIGPGVGMITSDIRRVEQVLLNLLSNAIKFTEQGQVTVACSADSGTVIVGVTDTGIGIRKEDIEKVFKPFLQIDSGIARRYEGTGLGLSICKRLVRLMGGDIWVESVLGEGSTFAFSLPKERSLS
ncbi:MAG: Non-motile and phage-resistance protein [Syntrophorhabdus sp. PtaU1.Bin058]|nr:MAG: Non-motile and phage-resistance protein [Syntrophorhabdus sp. PtaU1.Bin058]